jgi:probable HAF family extracellular repeat protein
MPVSIPLRLMTPVSIAMALGLAACASEKAPTEPSGVATPALAAVAAYTAVDLGTLDGSNSYTSAINPAGQVVGYSDAAGGGHAFLWSKGVMTDLGTLGGISSRAFGIDSAGRVVGGAATAGSQGNTHAFLWTKGRMQDLGTLGGTFSEADAFNPSGQIVGYSTTV